MRKNLLLMMLIASVLTYSCKKSCTPPTYPIEGLWIGTYNFTPGTSVTQTPQYFSFIIKPDSSLIVESQADGAKYTATGTWSLNGDVLNCKYTYSNSALGTTLNQVATALFSNKGTLSSGVWSNTDDNWQKVTELTQQGTFVLSRVN